MTSFPRPVRRAVPADRPQDEGAILIVALLVITVVAVVTGALLTRGDGSLRATVALREVAGSTYAADGAAQLVLNDLRTGYWDAADGAVAKPGGWQFVNEPGDGCFGRDANDTVSEDKNLLLKNFYPAASGSGDSATSAYVECVPETATGAQGTARLVSNANSPGDAIIMLGSSGAEPGLSTVNKRLTVRGGVRVNSTISAGGEGLKVNDANVRAGGACTGTIALSAGFTRTCSSAGVSDPNFAADTTSLPPFRVAPTGCGTLSYIAFEPGSYDDADALENLNGCNKTLWFKPGTYYFDFHNEPGVGDPLYQVGVSGGASDNEWTIANRANPNSAAAVIGGIPVDAARNVLPAPPASPSSGTSCQSPINNDSAQGVQFIFGGNSRLTTGQDAKVELCATYRSNRPPMVLYQNKTGGNPPLLQHTGAGGALTPAGTPVVTSVNGSDGTFTSATPPLTAADLRDAGNGIATWTRSNGGVNGEESRTITVGGFAPPTSIPKGAVVSGARLIVRHKSARNNAGTFSTVRITPSAAGTTALAAFPLSTRSTTLADESINLKTGLTAAQWKLFATGIHDFGYTGATIAYTAAVGRSPALPAAQLSAQLDALRLELDYYVPQNMRGPAAVSTNCVTTIGGCYLLNTHPKSELYLQGTTYLPQGRIFLAVRNTDFQVFRWGVIARSLNADLNGAYKEDGALIELPDNSPGLGLNGILVQFKVWICPSSPTCSNAGREALRVRAQIYDKDGLASTPDREITILNWSHTR